MVLLLWYGMSFEILEFSEGYMQVLVLLLLLEFELVWGVQHIYVSANGIGPWSVICCLLFVVCSLNYYRTGTTVFTSKHA